MEVDAGMTSIQTGGGRRRDDVYTDRWRLEVQVRMKLWKLWTGNIQKKEENEKKKKGRGGQDSTKNYRNSEVQIHL